MVSLDLRRRIVWSFRQGKCENDKEILYSQCPIYSTIPEPSPSLYKPPCPSYESRKTEY